MVEPQGLSFEWVHISHADDAKFSETYGFAGGQGMVNLEGVRIRPDGVESSTLVLFMHPASTLQLLPLPRAVAAAGLHVLCAGSRYARNDSALILEKVLLDLRAYIEYARDVWGYQKVIVAGWSGGGSLAMFYQAQAECPTLVETPAGDPIDIVGAQLIPADAVIFQAAHISRARLLAEIIDPSVKNEADPDDRDPELDIYNPGNPNQAPYSAEFISNYRQAQVTRIRRITAQVRDTLEQLRLRSGAEVERGFTTHRTLADPRFLDGFLEPNDRRIGWCYMGNPETVNSGPVGLARFSTLRSWLSQWSEDTNADAVSNAASVRAPLLVIENSADDGVPASHPRDVYRASASPDKTHYIVKNATHYYAGQPEQLSEAVALILRWLRDRGLSR